MKRVRWSDNIGTVGWTCIHANMNADDMEFLQEKCPRGNFMNTFYVESRQMSSWRDRTPEVMRDLYGDAERGFYFNFPEDERGKELIAVLQVMYDMGDRGEPC